MDNYQNQSSVAYGSGQKEVKSDHRMPNSKKQFGKKTMPQDEKLATKSYVKKEMKEHEKKMHPRHKEHR